MRTEKPAPAPEKPVVRVEKAPPVSAPPEQIVAVLPAEIPVSSSDAWALTAPRNGGRTATLTTGLREASDASKLGRS
ncbi:MAG: hypothetical protein ACK5MO_11060, partial [Planctomyces sp.]